MLGKTLTEKCSDHSDLKQFSFSFYCDKCGKEWKSTSVPFMAGGFAEIENEDARALVWANEHQAAFDGANLEAHFAFNHCPSCNSWVCDDCFGVSEQDGIGKCGGCREKKCAVGA